MSQRIIDDILRILKQPKNNVLTHVHLTNN